MTADHSRLLAARSKSSQAWLPVSMLIVVVLASLLAMSPNVADPDLWGHVQYGRDVLADGAIPATTSYSFTAQGYPWINHENLSEIVMAIAADSAGPRGLVLGKFLLSVAVVLLILGYNLRAGAGTIVCGIITLLVAANLGYHWSIRPQLASFFCFALLIALLQYSFSGWRDRWHWPWPRRWYMQSAVLGDNPLGYHCQRLKWLWLAPPIFFLWANSHGGFVAGLAVIWTYLGLRAIEAIWRRGAEGWGLVRRLALMAAACGLATLVNPYGPRLHQWLLGSLGQPRPEILDWAQVNWFSLVGLKCWPLLGLTVAALCLSRRPRDLTQLVVMALVLWQAATHFRHMPFFAILVGFWMGPHLHSALVRLQRLDGRSVNLSGAGPPGRLALAVVLIAAGLIGWRLADRLADLPVDRDQFPVSAVAFMRQHGLSGRLVVTYDWAQYAIAALCAAEPDQGASAGRVAFDGRFRTGYPQPVVDMHFDFLYGDHPAVPRHRSAKSPPPDPARVLRYGRPELVINRRRGELTEKHMRQNQDRWVLLYQDSLAQVWGLRSIYDLETSPWYLPPGLRRISNERQTGSVTWPAISDAPVFEAQATSRAQTAVAQGQP